ncbi:DUF502 domain-containing protein [Oleiharenicola lentus]|uniref:DUF502 domain-containing protein n=1 Tax=Oleiharenicola lentus TaxID=2508720 RepID=UPI003F66F340
MKRFKPKFPDQQRRREWDRRFRARGKTVSHYLLHGALIIAPFAITLMALKWLFDLVDGILRPLVGFPGLGFLIIVVMVGLVGWLSSFFVTEKIFELFDRWLERTPGVKFLYTAVRDFFDAFAGKKPRFQRTVLVNVHSEDVWMVGFVTDEDLQRFKLGAKFVAVYVPQAYNVAGQLYLVKNERVRLVEGIAPSDVMKYAVTGGTAELAVAASALEPAKA